LAGPDATDTLVRSIAVLAEQRRGALIVLPGRESIESHVDGGLILNAHVTEPLLLSLFDPHSPGHDGAVILSGDRASRFAVHLPLSVDHVQLGQRGTRHAAALGLAERTDALCIVVSEERGTVSVAEAGRLRTLDRPQEVAGEIRRFLERISPANPEHSTWMRGLVKRWREGLLAMPIAGLLWFLAIPGATVVDIQRLVPISVEGVPQSLQVTSIDPKEALVTLSGRRRDLYFLRPDALSVRVDAILVELGRRSFSLLPENVHHPEAVDVLSVEPDRVKVVLEERQTGTNKNGAGAKPR